MKKLLPMLFFLLFATTVYANNGDAFGVKSVYDKVMDLLLDPYVSKLIFAALLITGFIAMYKLGGIAGFVSMAVLLGIGFGYGKMDGIIDAAVTGALF